jgi:hypothetical protein
MQGKKNKRRRTGKQAARSLTEADLERLVEEATVDAYGESEQATGFYTMMEEHLALPFRTRMLGVEIQVDAIDLDDDEQIVARCSRARARQTIPILDLPLPSRPPRGAEWIEAYRRWAGRR